jgi:altronate dehydratase large subunit
LLIGSDGPRLQELLARVTAAGRLAQALCLDDCEHDALVLSDRALRMGAGILRDISRQRRVPVPLSALFLGVKCGRSDPSSGIASNPLIGHVADALVDAGGRVVFGETMEWLGAEHLLARRAISPEVGASLVGAVRRREELAVLNGVDLVGDNPNPTNVAAGISTIEEKSLGSVAKSGSRLIDGIVPMGARIDRPGLFAMDGPAYSPESLSGLVASGAQIVLFSTGVGNSYVSQLAPTVKLSANPAAAAVLRQQLDYDASGVLLGTLEPPQAARALMEALLEVASGSLTWGEVLDEGDEVVSRIGEAL